MVQVTKAQGVLQALLRSFAQRCGFNHFGSIGLTGLHRLKSLHQLLKPLLFRQKVFAQQFQEVGRGGHDNGLKLLAVAQQTSPQIWRQIFGALEITAERARATASSQPFGGTTSINRSRWECPEKTEARTEPKHQIKSA